MKREVGLFIDDILDTIKKIESFSKGMVKEDLSKDKLKQYALVRAIEIIGEASRNVPDNFRKKYLDVPWKEMVGMRDIVAHSYFKLDLDKVWKVIKQDIPDLKKKIQKVKEDLE